MDVLKITALAILLAFTSCKKYEEGPAISLKSKTARVANTWKFYKVEGAADYTDLYSGVTLELTKKGEATLNVNNFIEQGTWRFIGANDKIVFSFPGNDFQWEIIRLKDAYLKVEENFDGELITYILIPA